MGTSSDEVFRRENRFLAAVSPEDEGRIRPHLQPTPLERGKVLYDTDEPITRVYFPQEGVVSLVSVAEDGATAEMATVGNEGVVGIGALLDGDTAVGRHLVEVPGSALAIESSRFRSALRESESLRALGAAYARAFLAQVLHTVACNGVHSVEERCARWLLMTHDRSKGDTIALTQEFLAQMLGVRRPTVTVVARTLQEAGLIRYNRGAIDILDRPGLEGAACECYRLIRHHFERLFPPASA